ncbi:MAG: extracellular solute-binding protein [Anaerolineales bacterium]
MKKILFSLVIVALLLLTACGGNKATVATSQAPVGTSQAPGVTSAAPVKITYMEWGDPAELDVWKAIVSDFEAANPNITVDVQVSDWDSYWTKLKTLLAANSSPDVFAMDAPLYLDYQSRGSLLNLQPYIDQNPGMLDGLFPNTLEAYKTPQGYFGLPRDFQTIVVFYNRDMFDKAGVAYPKAGWTYDDLRATAKALTKDTNGDGKIDQFGYVIDPWDMEPGWSEIIWAYGGDIVNADHTKTLIGEPKARQALQFLYDMMRVDNTIPDPNTTTQYGGDLFLSGNAAMMAMGHWSVPSYSEATFKWDVVPMPAGPAGQATSVNSAGFVVGKDSPHPEAAFAFIKFVLSQAGQTRLAQMGFACPVLKSVAASPAFLQQKAQINHQIFIDSLAYAHMKPVFKGYDEWASVVGDGMTPVWNGEADLNKTLDAIVVDADAVLAKNK